MKICQWCNQKETKRKFCSRECFGEFRMARRKKYYQENKEREKETAKKYKENNKEQLEEYMKKWRQENSDHIKNYSKDYHEQNAENKREYNKKYYQDNIERLKECNKNRNANLSPEKRQKKREYKRNNYHRNASEKIRLLVSNAFRRIANKKPARTQEILGCTLEEAVSHIENLFLDGMSWDNYGTWHIDHIKPLASVDPNDIEALKELNKINNLRPLWATDNLLKGAKYKGVDYRSKPRPQED